MARPIEPTPTLRGEDAARLTRELSNVCAPAEAQRRVERARQQLSELTRPTDQELTAAAHSMSWSGDRSKSDRARQTLLNGGTRSVPVILQAVAAFPRADVLDEAAGILKCLAETGAGSYLLSVAATQEFAAPARATIARALGMADLGPAAARFLAGLLLASSAEVRDAALAALSDHEP